MNGANCQRRTRMAKEIKGACTDRGQHCKYVITQNGLGLCCEKCGRFKAVRKDGQSVWELLA